MTTGPCPATSRRGSGVRPRRRTRRGRAGRTSAARRPRPRPAPGRRSALARSAASARRDGPGRSRDPSSRALAGRARRGAGSGARRPRPEPRACPCRQRASSGRPRGAGTVGDVSLARRCSRTACGRPAVHTLTYVYADQTAVLGPLATYAEPHAYDLCAGHAERLSAPRGWEVIRLASDLPAVGPTTDDLLALADAVREAGRQPEPAPRFPAGDDPTKGHRRGHLRVLPND